MIDTTCQYYDGDEDCHKCVKNGFIFSCPANCPERFDDEQEDEMRQPRYIDADKLLNDIENGKHG